MPRPPAEATPKRPPDPPAAAFRGDRPVYFTESRDFIATSTWDRAKLEHGHRIPGPALIEEHASTTVIHPGDVAQIDAHGNIVIEIRRS